MMDYLYNDLQVKRIGEKTTVPNNDVARLMYYLSCVDTVINYNEIDNLTDYNSYYLLTDDEIEILIKTVLILNPKFFVDAGIFILDSYLVPDDMMNEFYEITDNRIGFHINEEIILGGKVVKVLKIMACRNTWLDKNYFNPLKNLLSPEETYPLPPPPPIILYIPPPREPLTPPNRGPTTQPRINPISPQIKPKNICDDCCCSIY